MNFSLEKKFGNIVVGIDEVGRGPLAGPVVAVAVHIKRSSWKDFLIKYPDIIKINDSKKLSKKIREKLYKILTKIISFGIGAASVKEIEEKNILQATLIAMERAYVSLKINADYVAESIARMDAEERDKFIRKMVVSWPVLTRELTNALENEMYDTKHYG